MRPVCKPESFLERRKSVLQVSNFYKTLVLCKTLIWDEKGLQATKRGPEEIFPYEGAQLEAPNAGTGGVTAPTLGKGSTEPRISKCFVHNMAKSCHKVPTALKILDKQRNLKN